MVMVVVVVVVVIVVVVVGDQSHSTSSATTIKYTEAPLNIIVDCKCSSDIMEATDDKYNTAAQLQ